MASLRHLKGATCEEYLGWVSAVSSREFFWKWVTTFFLLPKEPVWGHCGCIENKKALPALTQVLDYVRMGVKWSRWISEISQSGLSAWLPPFLLLTISAAPLTRFPYYWKACYILFDTIIIYNKFEGAPTYPVSTGRKTDLVTWLHRLWFSVYFWINNYPRSSVPHKIHSSPCLLDNASAQASNDSSYGLLVLVIIPLNITRDPTMESSLVTPIDTAEFCRSGHRMSDGVSLNAESDPYPSRSLERKTPPQKNMFLCAKIVNSESIGVLSDAWQQKKR